MSGDLPESYTDPAAVRRWCAPLLARAEAAGLVPLLGSPAWVDLDDQDLRKVAALMRAGLAWLDDSQPEAIAERLRTEMDFVDRVTFERIRDASHALSGGEDWSRIASGPTYAELVRRRADPGQLHREYNDRRRGLIDTAEDRPETRKASAA